jgi:CRISPR-associated endoribonuclease Cas6
MRFKLTLQVDRQAFGDCLPLNYQYELSAFIYRAIAQADNDYSEWLHENGFRLNGRPFKLFTFSNLIVPKYFIDKSNARLWIDCERVEWLVSFLPEASTEKFVIGLFSEQFFQIGDRKSVVQFRVEQIESLPTPMFKPVMRFRPLSPVCLSQRDDNLKNNYISPANPDASPLILSNLQNKYESFYGQKHSELPTPNQGKPLDFAFRVIGEPKSKLICIKTNTEAQTLVRGYDRFFFEMTAPPELMQIAYQCGIGEKNSMGFGMIEATC